MGWLLAWLVGSSIYIGFKAYSFARELPNVKTQIELEELCKRHRFIPTDKPVSNWRPSITIEFNEEQYRRWRSYHDR